MKLLLALALTLAAHAETRLVTWTGKFSDAGCATPRAKAGVFAGVNPDCAKKCLEKGVAPVFIAEKEKLLVALKGYPSVIADLGYPVEVHGTYDPSANTLAVTKVTRIGDFEGPSCARPQKQ